MKYIQYLSMFVAAALALVSCETGVDEYRLAPEEALKAVSLNAQGDVIVTAENMKTESVTFTCSEADFGQSVVVRYDFYLVKGDLEVLAGSSNYPSLSMLKTVLNGLVVNNLKVPAETTAEVGAYVVAYAGGSTIATPKSNIVNFNVTTFAAALKYYHICGNFQGWTITQACLMWEIEGGTDIYEGIYNLTEADYAPGTTAFKVMPNQAWDGGQKGFSAFTQKSAIFSGDGDDNLVTKPGIYKITVDIKKSTLAAEPISEVALKGEMAASNWNDPVHLTYDNVGNVWRSEEAYPAGMQFKVFVNGGWYGVDNSDAPTAVDGSAYEYGSGAVLTPFTGHALAGGDAQNIKIPAGGNYYVKVYLDRTPWLVTFELAE